MLVVFVFIICAIYLRMTVPTEPQPAAPPSTGSWTVSTIVSTLPGFPSFKISYPSYFSPPSVNSEIEDPGTVDGVYNGTEIVFYEPGSAHDFPEVGSKIYALIALSAYRPSADETLDQFVSKQPMAYAKNAIRRQFSISGIDGEMQTVPDGAMSIYYVKSSGIILQFAFTEPLASSSEFEMSAEASRAEEDAMASSIILNTQ